MQKDIEAFLKNENIIFRKNYEGKRVPFSRELNMESEQPVYYLLDHKIIIVSQIGPYVAQPFIEKRGL